MSVGRTFFFAFVLSLCILGLLLSFVVIEYNIRRTTYGQVDFDISYTLEGGVPVLTDGAGEPLWTLPARWKQPLATLVDAPTRLLLWLYSKVGEWMEIGVRR